MAKKLSLKTNTDEELARVVADKREELRALRFSVAGSKNRNVKQARTLRREIARALTETNTRPSTKLGARTK